MTKLVNKCSGSWLATAISSKVHILLNLIYRREISDTKEIFRCLPAAKTHIFAICLNENGINYIYGLHKKNSKALIWEFNLERLIHLYMLREEKWAVETDWYEGLCLSPLGHSQTYIYIYHMPFEETKKERISIIKHSFVFNW